MKLRFTIFIFWVLFISVDGLQSQSVNNRPPVLPLKSGNSVLFGKDIIINDQPGQDQRNVAVCSAFNGWLYAVYSYLNGSDRYITILRSTDQGMTWNVLLDTYGCPGHNVITKLNIVAGGNTLSTLKVFLVEADMDTLSYNFGTIYVGRYQGEPFLGEAVLLQKETGWYKDIAIACDQNYPANNVNPFSIGVLYSKSSTVDSLIFYSSSNGGISFDNRKIITHSNRHIEKVSLSYGRSATQDEGRYFAVWEEKDSPNATIGHIYSSHTEPNINSPFTVPVCLDSISPTSINKARNPVIACQASELDNDSSNLTEVLFFEKYVQGTNSFDIQGFYNLQATSTNHFNQFSISANQDYKIHPDITFNPYSSIFMVTYYDSTLQKLPFLTNDMNLANPSSWTIVNSGYNDSSNLEAPHPRVEMNLGQQNGVNVWIGGGASNNGVALFDAPYSTWTRISKCNQSETAILYGAYPNPCSMTATIWFEMQKPGNVSISLYDLQGRALGINMDRDCSFGKNFVKCDISNLTAGNYIYTFKSENFFVFGKIIIVR